MYTSEEFNYINNNLELEMSKIRRNIMKIWRYAIIGIILISIVIVGVFPGQFQSASTSWILLIYGGILLATFVGYIVSMNFISEKPFYKYLFNEIYSKINLSEGLFLEYKAYDKENRRFNKRGGLFTRFANVNVKRHITGISSEQYSFNIFETILTTSSGKSQQTHFNGVYYILKKHTNTIIQVRTSGSPKVKGVKYYRDDSESEIKVYKLENQNLNNTDMSYINFVKKQRQMENVKNVYLAVIENEIHFAVWYRNKPNRKVNPLYLEALNSYKRYFMDELKLLEELSML